MFLSLQFPQLPNYQDDVEYNELQLLHTFCIHFKTTVNVAMLVAFASQETEQIMKLGSQENGIHNTVS